MHFPNGVGQGAPAFVEMNERIRMRAFQRDITRGIDRVR